jgi:hypothetical protein
MNVNKFILNNSDDESDEFYSDLDNETKEEEISNNEINNSDQIQSNLVSREGMQLPNTAKLYATYLKKFAKFMNVDFDPEIPLPKEILNDKNISAWFENLSNANCKVSFYICIVLV